MWKKKEEEQYDEESLTTASAAAAAAAAVDPPDSSLELGGSTSYPDIDTWEMQGLTLGFVHSDGGGGGGLRFLENVSLSSCTWSDGVYLIPI